MGVREEHIDLVKRGMELLERRSYDEFRPYLTEDVVWYGAFQPVVQGVDNVIAAMKESDKAFGGTTEVESADFFADDDQVVSHEHFRFTRAGRTIETEAVHVTEFRDGKVSKMTVFTADPQALAGLMA
jgi:ketosteroid isomerase-like protein